MLYEKKNFYIWPYRLYRFILLKYLNNEDFIPMELKFLVQIILNYMIFTISLLVIF